MLLAVLVGVLGASSTWRIVNNSEK